MTPALAAIIASIKARDAQKPRRPTDPVPWDVQLIAEIEMLMDEIAELKADVDDASAWLRDTFAVPKEP